MEAKEPTGPDHDMWPDLVDDYAAVLGVDKATMLANRETYSQAVYAAMQAEWDADERDGWRFIVDMYAKELDADPVHMFANPDLYRDAISAAIQREMDASEQAEREASL